MLAVFAAEANAEDLTSLRIVYGVGEALPAATTAKAARMTIMPTATTNEVTVLEVVERAMVVGFFP
jgi:hypothetical protein